MDNIAERITAAIESGDFEQALPLIAEYGIRLHRRIGAAAIASEREGLFARALETLRGQIYLSRAIRSHISARLQTIAGQSLYHPSASERSTWRIEA